MTRAPEQFGIVITDLPPGCRRVEALTAVRHSNPWFCVVMITGYASVDSAVRAARDGAYDYLAKPFATGQLEVVLRRIEDRMALEAENRELSRRVVSHEGQGCGDPAWRLQAREERLAIEAPLKART